MHILYNLQIKSPFTRYGRLSYKAPRWLPPLCYDDFSAQMVTLLLDMVHWKGSVRCGY